MLNHISAIKNKGKGVTVEGEDKLERRGEEGKDKQSRFSAERRLKITLTEKNPVDFYYSLAFGLF